MSLQNEGNPIPFAEITDRTADRYKGRIDRLTIEYAAVSKKWSTVANLRLVLFVLIGATLWWFWDAGDSWIPLLLIPEVAVLIWLIRRHGQLRHLRDTTKSLITVNERALLRLAMNWHDLPDPPEVRIPRDHPYAWDLNIVGDASLLRRIGTPSTHGGWQKLLEGITSSAIVADVRERQAAVRELSDRIDVRQRVEAVGIASGGQVAAPDDLLRWAEGPDRDSSPTWLRWYARISPIVTVSLLLAQWLELTSFPYWIVPLVIQVGVSQTIGTRASAQIRRIAPLQQEIAGFVDIFDAIETSEFTSPVLGEQRSSLVEGQASISTSRLNRVCSLVIPSGTLLYIPFQMFFLWDVNVLSVMERWKRESGRSIRSWIDAVSDWEAISALAVLAHDHPDWAYPDLDPDHTTLIAGNLRHPLIAESDAVGNDVEIGPQGKIVFVTGSNMSGKSTLLRAIGINTVLARVGAPVAADVCRLPSLDIRSCMRVEDSIERGVSFFMAELLRLKSVVDAARTATGQPVLYLLDEILQGTNTAERQIASRQVMMSLATSHALGAVSSHDLELFDDRELVDLAIAVHFAEQFDRNVTPPAMHFDYELRPGIATSTNALVLMEMLGFDIRA